MRKIILILMAVLYCQNSYCAFLIEPFITHLLNTTSTDNRSVCTSDCVDGLTGSSYGAKLAYFHSSGFYGGMEYKNTTMTSNGTKSTFNESGRLSLLIGNAHKNKIRYWVNLGLSSSSHAKAPDGEAITYTQGSMYGIGIGYTYYKNCSINFEYENTHISKADYQTSADVDLDSKITSMALVFSFPFLI